MLRLTALAALAGFILALAAPVYAQVQPNVQIGQTLRLNPMIGAPAITKLNLFKQTTPTGVGVERSVQKPTLAQIARFDVSFDVVYQNGKTQHASKSIIDSGARATSFNRLFGLVVKRTTTRITTIFTTAGNLTKTKSFTFVAPAPQPPRPKPFEITQFTRVTQGYAANKDCFEMKRGASTNFPGLQSFNGFNVKLDVTFSDGAIASANADASKWQKIIAGPNRTAIRHKRSKPRSMPQ
jgi:hypothetical protein